MTVMNFYMEADVGNLDRTDRLLTVTVDGSGVIATLIRVVEWSIF